MQKEKIEFKEEKWNAVVNCDKNYDGLFYYGVKTTGIFCRPSCRAKAPLKENTVFFSTAYEAVKEGYRPCKICRPDIKEHTYEPNKELLHMAKEKLEESYYKAYDLKALSQEIGSSTSNLTRLFKEYYGVTPKEYILQKRIDKSMQLLLKNDSDILQIAYDVGFKSISSFYKCFKEKVGCTPKEYRKANNIKIEK